MRQIAIWVILYYLRFLAKLALSRHHPKIIGIAGSVGKSSTKNAIEAVLHGKKAKALYGNSETGIPLGILGIDPEGFKTLDWILMVFKAPLGLNYLKDTEYLIVEMGIDDPYPPKNMSYLLTILKPDIALSMNISATHTYQFEKLLHNKQVKNKHAFLLSAIAKEDTKIITESGCTTAIYNLEDQAIVHALENEKEKLVSINTMTFGATDSATISYTDYSVTAKRTTFSFELHKGKTEKITLIFPNVILAKVYEEVFAAAILVGIELEIPLKTIQKNLEENYHLPKGRGSIFAGITDSLIIDSSYNASKSAVLAFLELAVELKQKMKRPLVVLLGDMRELGDEAKQEHEDVALELRKQVDYLYCVGPLTQQFVLPIALSANKNTSPLKDVKWFSSSIEAGQYIKKNMIPKAIILIKGSQNEIYLEEAIPYLLQNPADEKLLCRQEPYWKKIKENFYRKQYFTPSLEG